MIAYDGSLQAARALAAFEATGLGEAGEVHIISVGASTSEAAEHAAAPASSSAITRSSRSRMFRRRRLVRTGRCDPRAGPPTERRSARDGRVRPAGPARVLRGVGDPKAARGKPGPSFLVPLAQAIICNRGILGQADRNSCVIKLIDVPISRFLAIRRSTTLRSRRAWTLTNRHRIAEIRQPARVGCRRDRVPRGRL